MGTTQKDFSPLGLADDGTKSPAIINNTWNEYRNIKRMNPSTIVLGLESRLHLFDAIHNGGHEPTPAMMLGTGIHALTLEPELFEETFVVVPDFHLEPGNVTLKGEATQSKNTNYYRQRYGEWADEHGKKQLIDGDDYRKARAAVQAISMHWRASQLVSESIFREVTVTGQIHGLHFKGRIDLLGEVISDIKTTVSVCPIKFSRQFNQLRYLHKLAIYRELVRQATGQQLDVEIIAVEKSRPFDVSVFPLDPDQLDRALVTVQQLVVDYGFAVETNCWPGRDGGEDYASLIDDLAYGRKSPARKVDSDLDEAFDWDDDDVDGALIADGESL